MQKIISLLFILFSVQAFSQTKYFQQNLDYTIDVRLNDNSHILYGFEKIKYTNNSPDTLRFLFFHLWPNAYRNDKTAFTEQKVENNETAFYFSKQEQRGFIDSLKFKVNEEEVNVSEYNNQKDIVLIELINPLPPNQTIEITTPFRVVLPEVFSRLGHSKQAYYISQWYPKPAVYDRKGWHPMPYLDQGEFYGEYGSFTVNITLPKNYVVAATGDLQNEEEKKFLDSRILKNDTSLLSRLAVDAPETESSKELKTITYKQKNVHDFAWFANKRYVIEKTIDTLSDKSQVVCYSFFTPGYKTIYEGSSKVTAQTIHYLSEHVGKYPYSQASVVSGKLIAGGGMEYPNVTVIGDVGSKSTLQTVIVHEVGHNWFYGLLGSNEREHPWMDEGINSFYETLIDEEINKQNKKSGTKSPVNERKILYEIAGKQNMDQPVDEHAAEYTKMNYGGIVYGKASVMFAYLQDYLGPDLFEKCMKAYYDKWHFKHPYPEDIKEVFEKTSGKDLSWFFERGLKTREKIDFALKKVKIKNNTATVSVKSRTKFTGPVLVNIVTIAKNDTNKTQQIAATKWIEYPYTEKVVFDNVPADYHRISIDANENIPEIKLSNNHYTKSGLFHRHKLGVGIGSSLGLKKKQQIFLLPALGYNVYDKFMLGLVVHNIRIPNHKFQFALAPMYSFGTKQPVGTGIIGYSFFPKGLNKVTIAVQGNSYHHNSSTLNIPSPLFARHIKIAPSLSIDFAQKRMRSTRSDNLLLKYYGIVNEYFSYSNMNSDSVFRPIVNTAPLQSYMRVMYTHKNNRTFNPFSYEINAIGNEYFLKVGLTANLRIDYHMKNKGFYVRTYLGKFFDFNTAGAAYALKPQFLNATSTDINDYVYDETYISRNQQKGFLTQPISMQEGGMKIKTNLYANPIGENNDWLGAVNLRTDIPVKIPIVLPFKFQLFFDACTFANASKLNPSTNKLVYDAGVQVNLFQEVVCIYVPLLMSKDFKDYGKSIFGKKRFENMITFSVNFSKLNLLNTQSLTKYAGL